MKRVHYPLTHTAWALVIAVFSFCACAETVLASDRIFTAPTDSGLSIGGHEAVWGDYDGDGDLDILMAALNHESAVRIYANSGDGTFLSIELNMPPASRLDWGDYDNDGDLDILLITAHGDPVTKIYRNDGDNTFTDIAAELPQMKNYSHGAWGDYDNDGDLDLLLIGTSESSGRLTALYRNDGSDTFTELPSGIPDHERGIITWGDYDADGDLDVVIVGGYNSAKSNTHTIIYRNNGDDSFSDINAALPAIDPLSGNGAWADYDGDGDLDLIVSGQESGEGPVTKLYINEGNDTFIDANAAFFQIRNGSVSWVDFDMDGDADVFVWGEKYNSSTSSWERTAELYANSGTGEFSLFLSSFVSSHVVQSHSPWGDADGDGDPELLLPYSISNFQPNLYKNVEVGRISGEILSGSVPLEGVVIGGGTLGDTVTNASGQYSFLEVRLGTEYTLVPSKAGYIFSPENVAGMLSSNATHNFEATRVFKIAGTVLDSSGDAIPAVTVDAGGLGFQVTDANGNFAFSSIAEGTPYTLVPMSPGYTFTPESKSGASGLGEAADFVGILNAYEITGTVSRDGEGIAGVAIDGGSLGYTTTDSHGNFVFPGVAHGTEFSVGAEKWGYEITPSVRMGTLESNTDLSFSASFLDSDGDGVDDIDEKEHGTDPLDRGDSWQRLGSNVCSEWNGFLGGMWNILEHVNLDQDAIAIRSELFDIGGFVQSLSAFSVAPGAQFDLVAHDMPGWAKDTYGKICSTVVGGAAGSLDGRMVYYKPSKDGAFEFAFAMPFQNGIAGTQVVPFNTYHPSTNTDDRDNARTNWIQLTNLEDSSQRGVLYFHDMDGSILASQEISLGSSARRDFSAHRFGNNQVGIIRWVPEQDLVKFQLRNVRYFFDNEFFEPSFDAAFQLEGRIGSGAELVMPLNTVNSTAVVEIANTLPVSTNATARIYDAAGVLLLEETRRLDGFQSWHLITDPVLLGTTGIAIVQGDQRESLVATAMHYGRAASGGISYLYGIQGDHALGSVLHGSYNTYLEQDCVLILANATADQATAMIDITRFDGTRVVVGELTTVPGHGSVRVPVCRFEERDWYGVVTVHASESNALSATVIRKGISESYRFPTPVR